MIQRDMILNHLKKHGSITPVEAMNDYGCMRLGARIWDLRDLGYDIETKMETSKNRYGQTICYAKYILKKGE